MIVIVGAIAELERNLIVERVRAGMRRAKFEGRHIGRRALELDEDAIRDQRDEGRTLRELAVDHRISTATVRKVLKRVNRACVERVENPPLWDPHKQRAENGCLARFGPCENLWVESQKRDTIIESYCSWQIPGAYFGCIKTTIR